MAVGHGRSLLMLNAPCSIYYIVVDKFYINSVYRIITNNKIKHPITLNHKTNTFIEFNGKSVTQNSGCRKANSFMNMSALKYWLNVVGETLAKIQFSGIVCMDHPGP